jgi:hypothetical protein
MLLVPEAAVSPEYEALDKPSPQTPHCHSQTPDEPPSVTEPPSATPRNSAGNQRKPAPDAGLTVKVTLSGDHVVAARNHLMHNLGNIVFL